ncbi:hypothetical protein GCM10022222_84690 [Amycolatopsis ultiminotia]|uniref:Thioesterase TesA-like domain-containing protein n=1 Tax=Amycolatopsis ultiminotia TaxID=543629 RepID=A0ABP6YQ76_9PSEU
MFSTWTPHLPEHIELLAAQYPGREDRCSEPFAANPGALADELVRELLDSTDKPLALFGHGLGAVVAYELALRLQEAGLPPRLLAVSGRTAPHCFGVVPESAEAAHELLRSFDAAAPSHQDRAFAVTQADFVTAGRYARPSVTALDCPVAAFTGDGDPRASVPAVAGWRSVTTGPFTLTVLPGGHFYLIPEQAELVAALTAATTSPTPTPGSTATAKKRPVPATSVPPHASSPGPDRTTTSPRIARLRAGLRDGRQDMLATFWQEISRTGTPLIEPGPTADVVTFVWRGEPGTRRVQVLANKLHDRACPERSLLCQVPDTDIWHLSYQVPADWRGSYQFVVDDARTPRADPLNPLVLPAPADRPVKSVAAASRAPAQRFCWPRPGLPNGALTEHRVDAPALGGARRVWVYTPPGHRRVHGQYPVLVVLDGDMWTGELRIETTLDTLIAKRLLPPLVALLPDSAGPYTRAVEYACHEPFAAFLGDDLLPWATDRFGTTDSPRQRAIAGQSLGGLAAAHAALTMPSVFGAVLVHSGSFWWTDDDQPEQLTRRYADSPASATQFHVDAGTHEGTRPDPTDRFVAALRKKGYPVHAGRFSGGHDRACWLGGLGEQLAQLGATGWQHT